MPAPDKRPGFSLIEVVVAVGIFATAVAVILALLPALARQAGDSADTLTAQRLPDGLRVELQRLAAGNFDGLASAVPVMAAPLDNGLELVANRTGSVLHSAKYLPPNPSLRIAPGDQYFLIEVWRFVRPPLSYDSAAAVLPLYVRVSWPYRNPCGTAASALADRSQLTFTIALAR